MRANEDGAKWERFLFCGTKWVAMRKRRPLVLYHRTKWQLNRRINSAADDEAIQTRIDTAFEGAAGIHVSEP
jgi:hypothetical protein